MKYNQLNLEVVLNVYLEHGIIPLSDVCNSTTEELMTNILNKVHKYKITPSKEGNENSRWSTYVKDDTSSTGRRKIAKKTKKELYSFLLDFYASEIRDLKNNEILMGELFQEWIDYKMQFCKSKNKKKSLSPSTINRYRREYKNYIAGTVLDNTKVREITSVFLETELKNVIENNHLKLSFAKNLLGYFRNAFDYAYRRRIVDVNEFSFVSTDVILSFAQDDAVKIDSNRVLTLNELASLIRAVREQQKAHPFYMPNYAIELACLTGMRVGELAALHWSDIDYLNGNINIDYSEHRIDYEDHSELVIDEPKCLKHRKFPINEAIRELLERIRALDIDSDYIFAKFDGDRYTAHDISCACSRRGLEAGITSVSIHRIRRTVASELRKRFPEKMVAAMMGHLEATDEGFYNYDNSEYEEKLEAVNYLSSLIPDGQNIVDFNAKRVQKYGS